MQNKIKILTLLLMVPLFFSSCAPKLKDDLKKAGTLSIASTKNVDLSGEYVLLRRNAGFDETQMDALRKRGRRRTTRKSVSRKTRKNIVGAYARLEGETINQAINNVVEDTPGGMFMENVEIFWNDKNSSNKVRYVVSGDVYGLAGQAKQIRGFVVNNKALYKNDIGTVSSLIDDQYCLWKNDKTGKFKQVLYDDLIKIGE